MFYFVRSLRFPGFSSLSGVVALAAAAMVLSGCEVTEASGDVYRSGPICPMIYDPVCAERRGQERTFPNACEAQAQNWRIVSSGQCRGDGYDEFRRDRDDRNYRSRDRRDRSFRDRDGRNRHRDDARDGYDLPDRVTPPVRPERPVRPQAPVIQAPPAQPVVPDGACPQVIQQVCGQLDGKAQMFMNQCVLQRAGAHEVAAGNCMGSDR